MSGQARFVVLLAAVSALVPLGGAAVVQGVNEGNPGAVMGGGVLLLTAVAGLLVLGRIIVLLERRRSRR
jgi:hypothetical protein